MSTKNAEMTDANKRREIAQQASVELTILLSIEQSLRVALRWMTRDRGNNHKLSTLRFHASSFERHLNRITLLADHGGYLHVVTNDNPHLDGDVAVLRKELEDLHSELGRINIRLENVSGDDGDVFEDICTDLAHFLDSLKAHGQREGELLQYSLTQEEGGSG